MKILMHIKYKRKGLLDKSLYFPDRNEIGEDDPVGVSATLLPMKEDKPPLSKNKTVQYSKKNVN